MVKSINFKSKQKGKFIGGLAFSLAFGSLVGLASIALSEHLSPPKLSINAQQLPKNYAYIRSQDKYEVYNCEDTIRFNPQPIYTFSENDVVNLYPFETISKTVGLYKLGNQLIISSTRHRSAPQVRITSTGIECYKNE